MNSLAGGILCCSPLLICFTSAFQKSENIFLSCNINTAFRNTASFFFSFVQLFCLRRSPDHGAANVVVVVVVVVTGDYLTFTFNFFFKIEKCL